MGRSDRVPNPVLVAYALPAGAVGLLVNLLHFFYLKFATDVLLVGPAAIGIVFGFSKLWDAVSDPLAGYWSDRTRTRWGRRRPWVLGSALPLGLAAVALWSPPVGLDGTLLVVWISLSVLAFYSAQTAFAVPHASWGAELSVGYHERSRVFGARELADKASLFVALGGLFWIERSAEPRASALTFALISLATVVVANSVAVRSVRELHASRSRGPRSPLSAVFDVWRNRSARCLLGVAFLEHLGFAAVGSLLPYASEYLLETPGFTAYYMLAFLVPIVVSIPVWIRLSEQFGKKRVWIVSMYIKVATFAVLLLVPAARLEAVFVCIAVIGVAHGCGTVIPLSIQADLVDVDELATGERKEGTYFAAWNLTGKAALALALTLSGLALDASGFRPNVAQSDLVLITIRLLLAGAPCLLLLAATRVLRRLEHSEATHERVRAALDARASAVPGPGGRAAVGILE